MRVTTLKVDKSDPKVEKSKFVRFSGVGCGSPGCHCSPSRFLSVSDGTTIISIELTDREFESLLTAQDHSIEIKPS